MWPKQRTATSMTIERKQFAVCTAKRCDRDRTDEISQNNLNKSLLNVSRDTVEVMSELQTVSRSMTANIIIIIIIVIINKNDTD